MKSERLPSAADGTRYRDPQIDIMQTENLKGKCPSNSFSKSSGNSLKWKWKDWKSPQRMETPENKALNQLRKAQMSLETEASSTGPSLVCNRSSMYIVVIMYIIIINNILLTFLCYFWLWELVNSDSCACSLVSFPVVGLWCPTLYDSYCFISL